MVPADEARITFFSSRVIGLLRTDASAAGAMLMRCPPPVGWKLSPCDTPLRDPPRGRGVDHRSLRKVRTSTCSLLITKFYISDNNAFASPPLRRLSSRTDATGGVRGRPPTCGRVRPRASTTLRLASTGSFPLFEPAGVRFTPGSKAREPMKPTFYITTAISYPNGAPHTSPRLRGHGDGHDRAVHAARRAGRAVPDRHGRTRHQDAADRPREGISARELADRNSALFKDMAGLLGLSNDDFIRTTEPRHHTASQAIWER